MKAKISRESLRRLYDNLRNSKWFHSLLTFLGFVVLSILFWCVMALNDNVRENLEVRLNISNKPDTVTFITVPPEFIHVSVQDKGTSLFRVATFQKPTVYINFRDFASDGVFKVSKGDFQAALKSAFSQNAVITDASIDSLYLTYTANRGKRVPVRVVLDATAASGQTISDAATADPSAVTVYSSQNVLDTILCVSTEKIVRRNLSRPTKLKVRIASIPGVRVIPDKVEVSIPVEPLVKKQAQVMIRIDNVPEGKDLLLFPQKARVVFYVPMSRFNDANPGFVVRVDYNDIARTGSDQIPLRIDKVPSYVQSVDLIDKSVDYTVVEQ